MTKLTRKAPIAPPPSDQATDSPSLTLARSRAENLATPVERRTLVQSSTLAAGAALLGVALAACGGGDKGGSTGTGGTASSGAPGNTAGAKGGNGNASGGGNGGAGGSGPSDPDADQLNELLENTYLAATAYSAAIGLMTDAVVTDPLIAERDVFVQLATSIQANHRVHAAMLVDMAKALGASPTSEATVVGTFAPPAGLIANTSITNALKFVASSERQAAVRTNQTLGLIEAPELRALASSIEGMQTQHFILLAALVAGLVSPGPNLDKTRAAAVFPSALVLSHQNHSGLDQAPPDYYR